MCCDAPRARAYDWPRHGQTWAGAQFLVLVMVALCNRADHYIFAVIYIFFSGPHNMVKFGLLTAEICLRVWGTPANFNGFRVLATLLHGTLVVDVSQTLQLIEQRAPPIFCRATIITYMSSWVLQAIQCHQYIIKLECGPIPNVMVAMANIGGALCSTPQSLADAHY